jgi:ribosomal protein L7/L12
MKLDKIKFACLIGWFSAKLNGDISENEIQLIDDIIDIEAPDTIKHVMTEEINNLMALMAEGIRKIEAIKSYRNLTGQGLKESKDQIEKYWSANRVIDAN